jgi:hypothetical protein
LKEKKGSKRRRMRVELAADGQKSCARPEWFDEKTMESRTS